MRTILLLLCTVLFAGCTKNTIDLRAGQRFVHPLVANQTQCDALIQNTFANCFQEISFDDNKNVTVIVTDIQNMGKYKVKKNTIEIEMTSPGDVEKNITLEIIDKNTLRFDSHDFKRWKGPGGWDFY